MKVSFDAFKGFPIASTTGVIEIRKATEHVREPVAEPEGAPAPAPAPKPAEAPGAPPAK